MIVFDLNELRRFQEAIRIAQIELIQVAVTGAQGIKRMEAELAEMGLEYARSITPVVTGSLQASHMITVFGDHSLIHINPSAVNPYSLENPPTYGPKVHAKSDDRAFYDRTVAEFGPVLLQTAEDRAIEILRLESLPGAFFS